MRRLWIWSALALVALAQGASAQEVKVRQSGPPPPRQQAEEEIIFAGPEAGIRTSGDTFVFLSTEMSFGGKTVKGAPYSAQAVTETVHTLADGNRIVRRNTANVYRDSEGRTRRDQTLGQVGPFAAQGDPPQTFFINDPVAGVNYILDPRTKTARKLPNLEFRFRTEAPQGDAEKAAADRHKVEIERKVAVETHARRGFSFELHAHPPGGAVDGPQVEFFRHSSKAETKTEKLEKRNVEGVEAEGTRTTTTIPAGEIGNEQPIQIVFERWYSPELQLVVMTRHSDPRSGETTYRLTNINRSEPAATLFQLPSDYTVKETRGGSRVMRKMSKSPALTEN